MNGKRVRLTVEVTAASVVMLALARRRARLTPRQPFGAMTDEEIAEVTQYFGEIFGHSTDHPSVEWPTQRAQLDLG